MKVSPYAMQRLIDIKDRFDIAFACDTDHDRHGIVTRSAGLLPPNHYLSAAIESFRGADHLRRILEEAQTIVGDALAASSGQPGIPSEPKRKEKL